MLDMFQERRTWKNWYELDVLTANEPVVANVRRFWAGGKEQRATGVKLELITMLNERSKLKQNTKNE